MIKTKVLKFIENIPKSNKAKYNCSKCGKIVIRFKSNAAKVKSCGCSASIKTGKHGCSNTYLYKVYHNFKNKYGIIEFKNFEEFKDWAIGAGWFPEMVIIRKNTSLGIIRNNLRVINKEEGIKKVRSKSSELTDKQKEEIIDCYKVVRENFGNETVYCLLNLAALQLNLSFCDVYKYMIKSEIDNNKFDGRRSYKRAWLLNNKLLKT